MDQKIGLFLPDWIGVHKWPTKSHPIKLNHSQSTSIQSFSIPNPGHCYFNPAPHLHTKQKQPPYSQKDTTSQSLNSIEAAQLNYRQVIPLHTLKHNLPLFHISQSSQTYLNLVIHLHTSSLQGNRGLGSSWFLIMLWLFRNLFSPGQSRRSQIWLGFFVLHAGQNPHNAKMPEDEFIHLF